MTAYVALLRAINVGGRNPVPMRDLAACFTALGYDSVRTYINSGNVLFSHTGARPSEAALESTLLDHLGFAFPVVLRSAVEMRATVALAPPEHGSPDLRSDVLFLKAPLTAEDALPQLPEPRDGVDRVSIGPGALYFSRVAARASQTRLTRIMSLPLYKQMTIRNWKTTTTLDVMLADMA